MDLNNSKISKDELATLIPQFHLSNDSGLDFTQTSSILEFWIYPLCIQIS
jgi:hypothetical protein